MLATLLLTAGLLAPPNETASADFVVVNAKVWTGNPKFPEAEAIAVKHGRILYVGTTAAVQSLVGPFTQKTIDAKGRRIVPGFYDSHLHFLGGGRSLAQVDLKDAADEAEFGKRLKAFDEKTPRDRWLLGGNWDHDRAFAGQLPTAAMLDKYVPNRPAFLRRYDGHMALANSAALKLAAIAKDTKDPPGGVIERLADGSPSGILKDNAMDMLDKLIPEPNAEEIRESVLAAAKACAANGITSVQDMDGSAPVTRRTLFRTLQELDRDGKLDVRVDLRWPIAAAGELAALGVRANFGTDFVRIGGVKGFMDGSLGSSTAMMFAPYDSNPKTSGVFVTEPAAMRGLIRTANDAGLSIAIHAIGDRSNAELLDLFAESGYPARRFRIEHAQHLRPEDYAKFKSSGVVASMQPYHVVDDGRWAEGRIGASRCRSSYAFRSLLDAGAVLAFGSDWPVAPLDVFAGIDAAVNRRTLDGKHPNGWFPDQRIAVAEALRAYTHGSAYAAFQETDRGVLEIGALADFAILSADILAEGNRDLMGKAKVDTTVVGGRIVYERNPTK